MRVFNVKYYGENVEFFYTLTHTFESNERKNKKK